VGGDPIEENASKSDCLWRSGREGTQILKGRRKLRGGIYVPRRVLREGGRTQSQSYMRGILFHWREADYNRGGGGSGYHIGLFGGV